jgi:choline dehydrogenase-like flavoprotein
VQTVAKKTVVVTGASAGVGRAIATRFGRAGANVGLLAGDGDALSEVKREIEKLGGTAVVAAVDVSDAEAVFYAADKIAERLGPIDIWIDAGKDFFGGYAYMSQGPLPVVWSGTQSSKRGLWGQRLLDEMEKYNHQVGLKIVGECQPQERNRVTLTDQKDQYALPVPRITYSFCDNDKKLIGHSLAFMRQALQAAGATNLWDETDDTCHLNGTARMGDDAKTSVLNADCRSWDIPICDGSVFPTVGGVNPSLTIQAIACRTADRIKMLAARGEL